MTEEEFNEKEVVLTNYTKILEQANELMKLVSSVMQEHIEFRMKMIEKQKNENEY